MKKIITTYHNYHELDCGLFFQPENVSNIRIGSNDGYNVITMLVKLNYYDYVIDYIRNNNKIVTSKSDQLWIDN